jgi:hypothetical protein
MPTIARSYTEIESLSREELDSLLEDELEFLSLVHKLDTFQTIQRIGSSQLEENVQAAQVNLLHEEQLKELNQEVQVLQQQTLSQKVQRFKGLEAQQDALCAPPNLHATLRALNKAKKEAFDESEAFAEEWVEEGATSNVDSFVKDFVQKRKINHQRAAKMELLQLYGSVSQQYSV